jgi:hypothetical protein
VGEAASYNGPAPVKKEENLPAPFARESCALSDTAAAAARPGASPVSPAKAPEAGSKVHCGSPQQCWGLEERTAEETRERERERERARDREREGAGNNM